VADPAGVRRSLQDALDAARRGRRDLTLAVMEVEGAEAGAAVARVADAARAALRSGDVLWRDGERSLVALLVDTDGARAEPALARLRLRLGQLTELNVRVGRAGVPPGIGAEDLLELAHLNTSADAGE